MIKLKDIINEGRTAYIFDFDDTIAMSDSWVYITKDGKDIKKLDAAEFAVHGGLATGEEYDFRDFDRKIRNPRLIKRNADILKKQLKKGYTTIYFMDDSHKNVRAVKELQRKYPQVMINTRLA